MAAVRRKLISTAALTSRKLAQVDAASERLYWRIYIASDMYGVLSGDPWDVWHLTVPGVAGYDEDVVRDCIGRLTNAGLLAQFHAEGTSWLHVVGHDRHQSADFLRKRSKRRTPVPPSEHDDTIRDDAKKATTDAKSAKKGTTPHVEPDDAKKATTDALSVSVSVSEETITSSPVVRPQGPSPIIRSITNPAADDEVEFVESVTAELAQLTNSEGEAAAVAEALLMAALKPHPQAKRRFPLSQWQAAVSEFGDRVRRGDVPRNPASYIIGMVPTAGAKLEIRPDVIGSASGERDRQAELDAMAAAVWGKPDA